MKALAFIDLLGFGNMVKLNHDNAKEILNDFYNISYRIISGEDEIQGDLFSDSLLAHSDNPAILVNAITKIYRECLKKNEHYHFPLNKYFLLPRGGISFGHVEIQSRQTSPNLTKTFILSPALVHSAKIESKIKGSRLLIADTIDIENQNFNWNQQIKSILYENSSFTFWTKFKYFDSLWFLDLEKDYQGQKSQNEELIQISEKLVEANKNSNFIDQHLQTLRVGLLSYTKFLTPNLNPLLNRFLQNYRDDKYWIIWLTLIEMIASSPENWALCNKQEIVDFYKEVSLKQGWGHVINEINKLNNNYLLHLFQHFISEMNP